MRICDQRPQGTLGDCGAVHRRKIYPIKDTIQVPHHAYRTRLRQRTWLIERIPQRANCAIGKLSTCLKAGKTLLGQRMPLGSFPVLRLLSVVH